VSAKEICTDGFEYKPNESLLIGFYPFVCLILLEPHIDNIKKISYFNEKKNDLKRY
jgi:hypothetical protein